MTEKRRIKRSEAGLNQRPAYMIAGIMLLIMVLLASCGNGGGADGKQTADGASVAPTENQEQEMEASGETESAESPESASGGAVSGGDGNTTKPVPVLYYQFDERWAKNDYDDAKKNDTLRRWACGPAVMAMAVAALRDKSVDPAKATAWSLKHDYYSADINNGKTKDGFFEAYGKQYDLTVTQLLTGDLRKMDVGEAADWHERAAQAVRDGDWVVCLMGEGPWTTAGHYILWYDLQGDDVFIRDSNSKKESKAKNKLATLQETVIRYWVIDCQDGAKNE